MCYLKSIPTSPNEILYPPSHCFSTQAQESQSIKNETQTAIQFPLFYIIPQLTFLNSKLQIEHAIKQALDGVKRNALRKLATCHQEMFELQENLETLAQPQPVLEIKSNHTLSFISCPSTQQLPFQPYQSPNQLTQTLFGPKEYKCRLALSQDFPPVLYRQRNIRLTVKLVAPNGQILKNGIQSLNQLDNVINLYLALCDDNGKWVSKNRVGDPMLKGRTSTELCSGESEFNKIYPQDITRTFLNGHLNIVVYAQSYAVVYDSTKPKNRDKVFVDPDFIEPLVLEKISVKAKKRSE